VLVDKTMTLTKGKFLLDSFYLKSNFFKLHTYLNEDDDPIEKSDGVGDGAVGAEMDPDRGKGIYESVTKQPINEWTSNTVQSSKRRAGRMMTMNGTVLPENCLIERQCSLGKNSGLMNLLPYRKTDYKEYVTYPTGESQNNSPSLLFKTESTPKNASTRIPSISPGMTPVITLSPFKEVDHFMRESKTTSPGFGRRIPFFGNTSTPQQTPKNLPDEICEKIYPSSPSVFTHGQGSPVYETESKIESNESGSKNLVPQDIVSLQALSKIDSSQPDLEVKKDSPPSNDRSGSVLKISVLKSDVSQNSPDGEWSPGMRAVGHLGLEPRARIPGSGSLSDRDRNLFTSMEPPT
jgi:hypothetical protein